MPTVPLLTPILCACVLVLRASLHPCRSPANAALPNVVLMQRIPPASTIVAYFDFVFKTSIAATMFPHLCQRLFAARNEAVMRRGMSMMNFRWGPNCCSQQ